ncbi:MAG: hypothetical protein L0220_24380 [Acidobacteria bacterium]|nr:hypothetical protein [Acidobacteriota bacterium]
MGVHNLAPEYTDSHGDIEIPEWATLSSELRDDLAHREVTKDIWNQWYHDQRHRLLNARAVLLDTGVWNLITTIGFGKLVAERKKYGRYRVFFIPHVKEWFLAIRTDSEIGPHLKKAGWSKRWNPNHPENRANWMQPGKDIVMHLGQLKFPANAYSWIHWDYGGGRIYHRAHLREVITGKGPSNKTVTYALGKTPAFRFLRGISEGVDKLLES